METLSKKSILIKHTLYVILFNIILFLVLAPLVVFYGPFHSLTVFSVDTILNSRHPQVAEFFLSNERILEITKSLNDEDITVEPVIRIRENLIEDKNNGIRIERIKGKYFQGVVMQITNPLQIKLAVTNELGTAGQVLSNLVSQSSAVAGINAGGFYDPNSQGNGAFPDGITVKDGLIIHNNIGSEATNMIGFDFDGHLIIQSMTAEDISIGKLQNAVSFIPNLIIDGRPKIIGDGGWGLAPRTGIGQKADGTVIFVVIDGRQPGWSMGATLRDLMNVFIEYEAENAANLDGGSSTEIIYQGQIINKLWNIYGERYIPTAFVVLPKNSLEQGRAGNEKK